MPRRNPSSCVRQSLERPGQVPQGPDGRFSMAVSLDTIKSHIPWPLKIAAKMLLSRLPISFGTWQRLGLFRPGSMDDPAYAFQTFRRHLRHLGLAPPLMGLTCLEIGPGDSLFSALIAQSLGAEHCILVDVSSFAVDQPRHYQAMADFLRAEGLNPPRIDGSDGLERILAACHAEYLTEGLISLRRLPSASCDFVWSQAVLEHIRHREFPEFAQEMRRVLKPTGAASHRVDLGDHLAGGLNNLRFPERVWESDWVARSGFYTNRIRFGEMLAVFRKAGFSVEIRGVDRWPALPTSRSALAPEFRELPEEDLLVSGFDVLLRPI